jgi:hypothetical protein
MSRALALAAAVIVAASALAPAGANASVEASGIPAFSHVYVIVMENKEYPSIVGDPDAPYINSLIARYGLATRYHAVTHPSEPNYLALFSGSTQGVTDDHIHRISALNVVDQLEAKGHSWAVFAENVPLDCYRLNSASGGPDGPGTYSRRHEPAIIFTDIARNPTRCAKITNFSHFDPMAAEFELIIPNICHDMHDCPVATGDNFLRHFVPKILHAPDFATSVLFLTWDEGTTGHGGGGHIATLVIAPVVTPGTASAQWHTHYSLLHTIQKAWGLGCLERTCSANDMREFFN